MNKEKLLKLAKSIERLPKKSFDMDQWAVKDGEAVEVCPSDLKEAKKHACGTTCCIAGYQVLSEGYCVFRGGAYEIDNSEKHYKGDVANVAADQLDLSTHESGKLFYGWNWPTTENGTEFLFKATPKGAANRIRHFVETGE